MEPSITPRAAKVLGSMIVTCGTSGCFEAFHRLAGARSQVALSEIGTDGEGNWLMSVFQRLKWYAADESLEVLDTADIVRYFGGTLHIRIMEAISDHAGLGRYLGKNVGLVTHVLLPLKRRSYANEGYLITFARALELNPDDKGRPFYHLGAIVNIPVTKSVVNEVLEMQSKSEAFMSALSRIDGMTIEPPAEYLAGLNCTSIKSKELR